MLFFSDGLQIIAPYQCHHAHSLPEPCNPHNWLFMAMFACVPVFPP